MFTTTATQAQNTEQADQNQQSDLQAGRGIIGASTIRTETNLSNERVRLEGEMAEEIAIGASTQSAIMLADAQAASKQEEAVSSTVVQADKEVDVTAQVATIKGIALGKAAEQAGLAAEQHTMEMLGGRVNAIDSYRIAAQAREQAANRASGSSGGIESRIEQDLRQQQEQKLDMDQEDPRIAQEQLDGNRDSQDIEQKEGLSQGLKTRNMLARGLDHKEDHQIGTEQKQPEAQALEAATALTAATSQQLDPEQELRVQKISGVLASYVKYQRQQAAKLAQETTQNESPEQEAQLV